MESDAPTGDVELAAVPGPKEFFGPYTLVIEVFNLETFKAKLTALNRKAERYHLPAVTYRILQENFRRDELWNEQYFYSWDVEVTGTTIQVKGDWVLIGAVDHRERLIKSIPNADCSVPPQYLNAEPVCDHCHVLRDRSETFIVAKFNPPAGETVYRQVGRTCLKDFMGIEPARALLQFEVIRHLSEEGEDAYRGQRTPAAFDLEIYLACVISSIRTSGWVGRAAARENGFSSRATADIAFSIMMSRPSKGGPSDIPRFSPEDRELAKRVVKFMKELNPGTNEYLTNVQRIGENGFVTASSMGYAASAVTTYHRQQEQLAAAEALRVQQQQYNVAQYLGEVKEKVRFHAKVTASPSFPNDYTGGVSYYHRMRTNLGQLVEWRTQCEMEVGRWYSVAGTIKKLDTWQGMPETQVTRCTYSLISEDYVKELGYE